MKRADIEKMVQEIDPVNAQYIMSSYEIQHEVDAIERWSGSKEEFIPLAVEKIKGYAQRFNENHLTPANAKVGDGATVVLYSDRHAGTIVKVTKTSVTVRRDKATLDPNFKPEVITGGYLGVCINQNNQSYTYEPDENGAEDTIYWSKKYNKYGRPNNLSLVKGRHEFYDYNF